MAAPYSKWLLHLVLENAWPYHSDFHKKQFSISFGNFSELALAQQHQPYLVHNLLLTTGIGYSSFPVVEESAFNKATVWPSTLTSDPTVRAIC